MSRNDEVLVLKQKIQDLERRNAELEDFVQDCLTKIGDMTVIMRGMYGHLQLFDEWLKQMDKYI